MDSCAALYPNLSPFSSLFLYTQLILLLILVLYYRSRFLIRLKFFFYFLLCFLCPNRQTIQAIIVVEEHKNQLFGSIYTYITYKLLPPAGGVVKIAKPRRSNTLACRVDPDQEIPDSFWGVPLKWVLRVKREKGFIGRFREARYFELYVPQKLLAEVRSLYLQSHVMEEAARIRREQHDPEQEAAAASAAAARNDARFGWIHVIAGLLIQLMGCC